MGARLWASLVLNLAITFVEFIGGMWSGSVALMADAAHNLADVGALGMAIFARSLGRRGPTLRHTYGFKRAEVIAALLNAGVLIAISVVIVHGAIARLRSPAPVDSTTMLTAAVIALVANGLSVFLLRTHSHDDINVRSAFLHLLQDALASLAVVIAALVSRTSIGTYVDPLAAMLISVVVLRSTTTVLWKSLHTLLEATPDGVDLEQLVGDLGSRFPDVQFHHVHVCEVGPSQWALTAHMRLGVTYLRDAEARAIEVRQYLRRQVKIGHVTLESEAEGCGSEAVLAVWI
ncbi:MAG: cation diffusion facilitator family transporter [Candidatus Solibacter sp.]